MANLDWSAYVSADINTLLLRLAQIAQEMGAAYLDLSTLQIDERREKARAWQETDGSAAARDRWAQIQSLGITTEIIPIEAQLNTLRCEYDLILTIISARFDNGKHIDDLNNAAAGT